MNYSHIEVIPLYSNVASEIGYHIAQNSNGLTREDRQVLSDQLLRRAITKRGERWSNKRNMNNVSAFHIRSCECELTVHVVLFGSKVRNHVFMLNLF